MIASHVKRLINFSILKQQYLLRRLVFVAFFLLFFVAGKGQTVVWSEGFEEAGAGDVYTTNQASIPGFTNSWSYEKTNNGRLRFDAGAGYVNTGSRSATFDANPTGTFSQNYIIALIDLSAYSYFSNFDLSFSFMEHGDENHATDAVWVRSGNDASQPWVQVYSITPQSVTDGTWVNVTGIDLVAALSAQPSSPYLQIRFGQEDNWNTTAVGSNDGITYDDIVLTGYTAIWQENFTYTDGTTTGTGSPSIATWNSDGVDGNTRGVDVRTNQMRGRRTLSPGLTQWVISAADPIEIGGFTDVSITMDVTETSNMEAADNVLIEYELDNSGTWIQFATNGNPSNDFTAVVASQTGLSGTTLRLRVTFTSNGNENHFIDNINVTGTPSVAGSTGDFYYSYQSGNWDSISTWTHDPGGTTQTATDIPNSGDNVIILNSRTVSLSSDVDTANLDVTIREGGILDQTTNQFTAGLSALRGSGTLKLASVNFPVVTTNDFVDTDGGTTEYNNTAGFTLPAAQTTYYHLRINTPGVIATQLSNITLNGDLNIKQGTYQINDNSANRRQLTINGNVTVDNGASFTIGTGNTDGGDISGGAAPFTDYYDMNSHRVVVYGDFTNNGTVSFTNQTYPVYDAFPVNGMATLYFMGATDNTLTCNGTTDLYNLVLDKGIDQTYKLTVYSSDYQNFRLFGRNNVSGENGGANPDLRKALWIRTGTLELTGLTIIPSLTEGGGPGSPNGDFYIPANGCLLLNGSEVAVLGTANDYAEINAAYNLTEGTGSIHGVSIGPFQAFSIYGKLQVNDGYLSTRRAAGFITWATASGEFIVNGGKVDARQLRSNGTVGLAAYYQTGGEVTLRGRYNLEQNPSTVSDIINAAILGGATNTGDVTTQGTLNINNAENVFNMSGGIMNILSTCNSNRAIDIYSADKNISVTGGTINITPQGTYTGSFEIRSNAPFYNLTINNRGTGTISADLYNDTGIPGDLTVINDLDIIDGTLNARGYDVSIGGDFNIENGAAYTPGNNSTVFNGSGNQTLTFNNAGTTAFKKLKVDKPAGTSLTLAGTGTTLSVEDSLMIYRAELADGGKTIQLTTSGTSNPSIVYNSGVHSGIGKIEIADTDPTVITGDGSGIFENLELNNSNGAAAPVSLGANTTINGTLTFSQDNLFDISTYNLNLGALATVVNASATRFVQTAGTAGDGGVTKQYSASSNSFVFPVGAASTSHAAAEYTPATISFGTAPTTYGTITIVPVGYEHPNTTTKGRSLTYFWRTKSSGFTLGSATVNQAYTYSQNDVVTGGDVNENEYVAAVYDNTSYSWTKAGATDVDEVSNVIGGTGTNWQTLSYIDGEFTAGDDGATDPFGVPTIYYSRANGNWNATTTWSNTGHTGAASGSIPGANDIVIVGNNNTVTLTQDENCASLQIESGAVLDVTSWTGSTFSIVLNHSSGNNGLIRVHQTSPSVSLFTFPSGDFSDFNVNLGTTEFYTTTNNASFVYILPPDVTSYGNLILSPNGLDNLSLPNTSYLTIYGDLTINSSEANSWTTMSWNTTFWGNNLFNPTLEKTVHILGDLNVDGGSFVFMDDYQPQHLIVENDINIGTANGANIFVLDPNTWGNWLGGGVQANSIHVGGSIFNNCNNGVWWYPGLALDDNTYYSDLTFFGEGTHYLTNTGGVPETSLHSLTINKGSSQADSLILDIGGILNTPNDNWLTLQNGTFKYVRDADLNITTTSTFNIPSTAGLYVDATGRTIRLANASSDNNDVYLNGKLTIIDGNVTIGNTNNNNQDIEYSGGGNSEIDIRGGTLFVNGQIRRNPSTTAGVLKYAQSGGDVTINGRNTLTSNAKLEILNAGSEFNMSGGTLTIVRGGGGGTYGDLYLRPASSTVTAGEIIFTPGIAGGQDYIFDAAVPIWDLTINGNGGSTANVELLVSPLEVNGNLSLVTATSTLDANITFDIDVTINGDFTNNGTYTHRNNHTYFTGGVQALLGTSNTSFYDLTINPVTSESLSRDITVYHDMFLNSGTLICNTNTVNAKGNVTNNATYTDNNAGIALNGTALQYLGGTGTWGQLELNNSSGARLVNAITLQSDLLLTTGIFDINRYLLTLGANSDIVGSGYSNAKMITSDGVFSNVGISKVFSATADGTTFTFPLGTSGKYTPATLALTNIGTTGAFRINNINSNHPGVLDPTNVLDYFWEVESSGITGFDGILSLEYLDSDVQVTGANAESDYIAAALLLPGTSWTKATAGAGDAADRVYEASDSLLFYFSGSSSLSGEYTCGIDTAMPNNVPEFTSNTDGNWSNPANWTQTGGDSYTLTGGPNGFIVTIRSTDGITTDANYASAYRTTIEGTLTIPSATYGHNLGTVSGSGTLALQSGTFPAGRFTDFLDCANNATLEYGGTGSYTLISDLYSSIPNLHFTGTGSRVLPNKDLTICNQLLIDGPTLDNSVNNSRLTIQGTMERYTTGAFLAGTGSNATVAFAGSSPQTLGGVLGDFSGANAFNNLEIDNSAGLTINSGGAIEITRNLLLTNGLITTSSTNTLSITNTAINCVMPSGGSSSSYVDGPLTKTINQGDNFSYPIGKGIVAGNKINLSSTQSGTQDWTVEYFTPNPTATNRTLPLTYVNNDEYWTATSNSGNQAIVNIDWDASSDLTPLMTQNGLSDMRVANYNTTSSEWEQLGSSATGSSSAGTVSTTSRITIPASGSSDFTVACINLVKPRAQFTPSGAICGTTPGIPVTFTYSGAIPFDYTLDYNIDGVPQTQLSITSAEVIAGVYTLATPSIGVYELTDFTYNSGADVGVVDPTTVEVYQLPTTADIGSDSGADDDDISTCGGSTVASLPGNSPTIGTGLWSVISGTGGSFVAPTVFNTAFNGTNGSTYQLEWEITNGACTSSDTMIVTFPLLALQPGAFTASTTPVCQSTNGVVYTVPNDASVTYSWSYSGTGVTVNGTGNSVTLDFDATSTSGTLSVNATNGCGTSADRSIAITVNGRPTPTFTAEVTSAILGSTGNVYTTQAGESNYVWNVSAGGTITAGGTATDNSVTVTWNAVGAQTVTVNYDNASGCDGTSPATSNVTVINMPIPTLTSSDANDTICLGEPVTFTAGGGDEYEFLVNGVTAQAQSASNLFTTTSLSNNDTVTVRAVFVPSGVADTSAGIGMTVHALPNITLTVDPVLDSICTGSNTQLTVTFTAGLPDYSFTIQALDEHGTSSTENISGISAGSYSYTPATAPIWVDDATPDTDYIYSITTITDGNGCSNLNLGSESMVVFKIPETGTTNHVDNNWGN